MAEYIPSPDDWVREQVELYEGSGGTDGTTLLDTGLPVIIVTNRGNRTGAIRKTPLMRVKDGNNYVLVASRGGAPKNPVWVYNLRADRDVEIRDGTDVYKMPGPRGRGCGGTGAVVGPGDGRVPSLQGISEPHDAEDSCVRCGAGVTWDHVAACSIFAQYP